MWFLPNQAKPSAASCDFLYAEKLLDRMAQAKWVGDGTSIDHPKFMLLQLTQRGRQSLCALGEILQPFDCRLQGGPRPSILAWLRLLRLGPVCAGLRPPAMSSRELLELCGLAIAVHPELASRKHADGGIALKVAK